MIRKGRWRLYGLGVRHALLICLPSWSSLRKLHILEVIRALGLFGKGDLNSTTSRHIIHCRVAIGSVLSPEVICRKAVLKSFRLILQTLLFVTVTSGVVRTRSHGGALFLPGGRFRRQCLHP